MSFGLDIHIQASFLDLHLWYFPLGHHFITILWYHISPLVIFILCLFFHHWLLNIILVSPWVVASHTSLHGGLSRSSPHSPYEQWFRDLILKSRLVSEDSCYISTWGGFIHLAMYFTGDHSLLIRVFEKKNSALFILLFSIGHVYGRANLLHWVHVLEGVCMRASLWDSILVYFGWEYEAPTQFLWERRATFL